MVQCQKDVILIGGLEGSADYMQIEVWSPSIFFCDR